LLRTPHDDRPVPAAAALTGPGNALLDEVAAEVGVDKAPFGTVDRIAKGPVADAFPAREPREFLRLEDPHGPPPPGQYV
jgi:hypothetical protein